MDRGAWQATIHESQRVRHDLVTNTQMHMHKLLTVHSHEKNNNNYSLFEIISEVLYFLDFGIMMLWFYEDDDLCGLC